MARGGRRQGKPGGQYANRTDLALGPRKLPVTTAPNQTYGEAGQQQQAQQAVSMGSGPLPSAPLGGAPGPGGLADALGSAQGFNPPPVPQMSDPTANPAEHAMTPPAPSAPVSPLLQGAAILNALGDNASPVVKALRNRLNISQANQSAP